MTSRITKPLGLILLAAFFCMVLWAAVPHSHGTLDNEHLCPRHLFAGQAQEQFPLPAVLVVSFLLCAYVFVVPSEFFGTVLCLPGLTRAPPAL